MDTKKLRQKILDLAIRGKLVPQDPNDEPASVLLERIRAEKERLIKEGKIKRSKKSASDDEIEATFEIPESWEWTTIEDLLINRDSERVPLSLAIRKKQTNKIYDYYGAAGVIDKVDGYLFSERLLLIGEDGANLLSRSKDNAFFAEGQYWVNNHAHVLDCSEKYILDFVAFVINSMSLEKYVTGSAQPKLTQDNLNKIIISLPPKEEQRRIINAVERWFTLIDELESNEGDLLKTIDKAKSKILDLAIHGKLVPQDPSDEPAIELLKRIRAEKERLIKEGKIKRSKKSASNDEIEASFEIPESWEWVRLDDLAFYKKGPFGSSLTKSMFVPDTPDAFKVYEQKNAINKNATLGNYFIDAAKYKELIGFAVLPSDIIVSCAGTIGETYILPLNIREGIINQALMLIRLFDIQIMDFYLLYFDYILKNEAAKESKGTAIKNIPPFDVLKNFLIPLPPYAEQLRIVAKIEELFAVLDGIKESLEV